MLFARTYLPFLAIALSIFTVPSQLKAQDPSEVGIDAVEVEGPDCPADRVSAELSPDIQSLMVKFRDFRVHTNEMPASKHHFHKTCKFRVVLRIPKGFAVSMFAGEFNGSTNLLDAGITGWQQVEISLKADHLLSFPRMNVPGPYSGPTSNFLVANIGEKDWSPCEGKQRRIKIYSRIGFDRAKGNERGELVLSSDGTEVTQQFLLHWRDCNRPIEILPE